MKIPRIQPPPRCPSSNCTASSLTPLQEIEAWSWWKAKQHLGSFKSKAAEMGIPTQTLYALIKRMQIRDARRLVAAREVREPAVL